MQICQKCGASNIDAAKFCNECAAVLGGLLTTRADTPPASPPASPLSVTRRASDLSRLSKLEEHQRSADIVFVLDCTGSMGGELSAIRDAFSAFADSIRSYGVRARVALVEFRDRLIGEEHRALLFDGEPFTSDPDAFRREVSKLKAGGGGDEPESSLDAVLLALRQPFAPGANRVLVLVTDAPPHVPDRDARSVEEVAKALQAAGINQVYLIIRTMEPSSQVYLKLLEGTRGMAFDLGEGDDFARRAEDFKRTLMGLVRPLTQGTR